MTHREWIAALAMLAAVPVAQAEVSVGVGIHAPGVQIGLNVPAYPTLRLVPGVPVYHAPDLDANYFFFDGLYWVYAHDAWHSSDWYNGPWVRVAPAVVPVHLLQVPVRYFHRPPAYFRPWRADAPPRWARLWGPAWEARRIDWQRPGARIPPAPLPAYQRGYAGPGYPDRREQQVLQDRHYRYVPADRGALAIRSRVAERAAAPPRPLRVSQRRATPDDAERGPGRGQARDHARGHGAERRPDKR